MDERTDPLSTTATLSTGDPALSPDEAATVDPDEAQFRADTLLMHAELLELDLYTLRRRWFQDPELDRVSIGAGNPAEQTIRGHQRDPFNGVAIFNPTQATLAIGFQAGTGPIAIKAATVPPFTWATFPERFVNLSIYLPVVADQAAAIATPVTVLRLKFPPNPAAGPYATPTPWTPTQPTSLSSMLGSSTVQNGLVLDNGFLRSSHSMIVSTSAGVTAGVVQLQGSIEGTLWAVLGSVTTNAASTTFLASLGGAPMRYLRAAITTAIAGGTVNAVIASV